MNASDTTSAVSTTSNASDSSVVASALPPSNRGRGRKPVALSNAREWRDRITAWKLTPEEKRQPPTLTALAVELGISKSLTSYYAQQVPETIEEFVDDAEREALGRYPGILKTLGELAQNGSVEAIKVYIRELAGPRRPQQSQSAAPNLRILSAIQVLVRPDANSCVDVSNRPILSNSQAIEKSAS